MADPDDVVLQDAWSYLAVTQPGRLAASGAICILEFGNDDTGTPPDLLPLDLTQVQGLITALQLAVAAASGVRH